MFSTLFFHSVADRVVDVSADPHGTSVAGVAAARNNSVCGVGSAYFAEIASVRLTAGPTTDAQRATAMTYKYNDNDIFSASFGPVGTGKFVFSFPSSFLTFVQKKQLVLEEL